MTSRHRQTKFSVLWNSRFQVWPRMEEGAQLHFKIIFALKRLTQTPQLPPPSIDFIPPSPTIGLANMPVVDSPWLPHFKTKVEEVTINQKESKSLVTATTTRRKQQQQMIHQALLAEEDKRRIARENCLMTSVPVCLAASIEPALMHSNEDHEDALQEEMSLAVATRRMSVAVVNRASNVRNLSGRHGSVFFCRPTIVDDDDRSDHMHSNHVHLAQSFFPSSICQSTVNVVQLLDDLEVNVDGVSGVHYIALAMQIGFIMFHVRSPSEGGIDVISETLSVVWQVAPCVTGIYFKDLKQTLRKEQCDAMLLIAANVPSAKKLIVHGPDLSCIPSQFLIQEDTKFEHILQESLEFFNIPADEHEEFFLVDTKSNHMHNLNSYVRDFYFFRRNFYPQLSLVRMDAREAKKNLLKQTFVLKFLEMEKVLFALSVLNSSQGIQFQSHVTYLHEELIKLPSFPRKALETEFNAYHGEMKDEIMSMDMLHKFAWTKLVSTMFRGMSSTITHVGDLPLFLNVINGVLILHAEDSFLFRYCIATYINVCKHFKQVFASTGFSFIMPSIMKVYSSNHTNDITMFGSVSGALDLWPHKKLNEQSLDPRFFYWLLVSLNNDLPDNLHVLELLDDHDPIQSLDFCYKDDSNSFTILDAINLCVTIIAHSPESLRATQMLVILETILPHFLAEAIHDHRFHYEHQWSTLSPPAPHDPGSINHEISIINSVAISMRVLISSCESLSRGFNKSQFEPANKPFQGHNNQSPKPKKHKEAVNDFKCTASDETCLGQFGDFVKPRNSLLSVASDFYDHCSIRMKELHSKDSSLKLPELLDHKSHIRLADVCHSLMKVSTHDPSTINSLGLQKYMKMILPNTDWSQTNIRPALNLILRRVERFLNKIHNKSIFISNVTWKAVTNLVNVINLTLCNCSYIGHLPQMKVLVYTCMHIIMGDDSPSITGSSFSIPHHAESIASTSFKSLSPTEFNEAAIKLAIRMLYVLQDTFSMELLCEASTNMFSSAERLMNGIINIVFPMSLQLSNQRYYTGLDSDSHFQQHIPCMKTMSQGKTRMLHFPATKPNAVKFTDQLRTRNPNVLFFLHVSWQISILLPGYYQPFSNRVGGCDAMAGGSSRGFLAYSTGPSLPPENSNRVLFLALKMLVINFEKQLSDEWHKISKVIVQMSINRMGGTELWTFIDFITFQRGPLFLFLLPLIHHQLSKGLHETSHKYQQVESVKRKLMNYHVADKKSAYIVLENLSKEMNKLKDEGGIVLNTIENTDKEGLDFEKLEPYVAHSETLLKDDSNGSKVDSTVSNQIGAKKSNKTNRFPKSKFAEEINIEEENENAENDSNDSNHKVTDDDETNKTNKSFLNHPAFLYKSRNVIKPSDGNLILFHYFKEKEKMANNGENADPQQSNLLVNGDADMHRLQRQDAKSRKTFKIKRHCSTFNRAGNLSGSMLRSATVKGVGNRQTNFQSKNVDGVKSTQLVQKSQPIESASSDKHSDDENDFNGNTSYTKDSQQDPCQKLSFLSALNVSIKEELIKDNKEKIKSGEMMGKAGSVDFDKLHKKSVYRSRFMQKSKSHEDDAPVGTARGRIARHGAKVQLVANKLIAEKDSLIVRSDCRESEKDENTFLLELVNKPISNDDDEDDENDSSDVINNDDDDHFGNV
ncbi:hypothetical protein HELRODRAFT_191448 [Helobdella robusta]|uniref:Uncharacterized protein n=1 Tax=Helobdella robusta TaxID=6412 RepID=T1FT00_HELRO|nr:hypothetical protein HELRODRAFT_191448 [Helobdella robusta]ESO05346.1 hypothetical protein HELRODRAFT_191448 [Helobdella robusta]